MPMEAYNDLIRDELAEMSREELVKALAEMSRIAAAERDAWAKLLYWVDQRWDGDRFVSDLINEMGRLERAKAAE